MPTETELERMVVRLIGDSANFEKMVDRAVNKINEAERSIDKSTQNIGKAFQNAGMKMKQIGTRMSLSVTAPLVAMGAVSVKAFADFDQAMTESTSIMKVTENQISAMRTQALELSGSSIQGPEEMARSYFFLASAGKDAEQSMALLPKVSKFAAAGAFDMALATDLLTDAQSALGLTSKDTAKDVEGLSRVADVLVKANTLANASVQQFSESLTNTSGATLKTFNKSVEEGVAVLAAYADQGIKGNVAGTNLTRITTLLAQSSRNAAKEHARLGFSVFDATGKMRNYADIIQNLEQITDGMSDELKSATLEQLGFQARVQQAILPLLGSSEAIRRYEKELKNAGGTVDDVANKQMKSFTNQMKILNNQITATRIAIGEKLAPAVGWLAEKLKDVTTTFTSLNPSVQNTILILAGVAAAIGPLLILLGVMATSISSIISLYSMWAGSATAVAVSITALKAALSLLGIGIVAAGAAIVGKLIADLMGGIEAMEEFNDSIEKSDNLLKAWGDQAARQASKIKESLEGLTPEEKKNTLKEEFDVAQASIKGASRNLDEAKRKLKEVESSWINSGRALLGYDAAQREAEQAVKEAEQSLANQQTRLEEIQKLMDEQSLPEDVKQIEQQAGQVIGDDGASLIEDEATRAKALSEQFMDPVDKFDKEIADLEALFDKGLIDQGVFERARDEAIQVYVNAVKDPEHERQVMETEQKKVEVQRLEEQYASPQEKLQKEADRMMALIEEGLNPEIAKEHLTKFAEQLSPKEIAEATRFLPSVAVQSAGSVASVAGQAAAMEAIQLAGPEAEEKEAQEVKSQQLVDLHSVLLQIKDLNQVIAEKETSDSLEPARLEG